MPQKLKMLAADLGASSGKVILGILKDGLLSIEELHRFPNEPVEICGNLHWDTRRLFHEIKQGIAECIKNGHRDIDSVAIDTWGVDFGLLDREGNLLGNPYHYRDSRTDGMMEEAFKLISRDELYEITGIQFMKLNTVFQLLSLKLGSSCLLREAGAMLLMPDLFNYFLTGVKSTECSIASTTQLFDAEKRAWSKRLTDIFGLPEQIFTAIKPSGTRVGVLTERIAKELGTGRISVIAAAGHDTQCAIASVPAEDKDFVYISCGTWSLMGVESDKPIINKKSESLAFTNEVGVENRITFLKNIMGLWLVQECKRQWKADGEDISYGELEKMAEDSKPFESFIDPDDESFMARGDMPRRIQEYCVRSQQKVPGTKGEIVRCITESLAMKYRMALENLEDILGKRLSPVHVVGGGIKDRLLCRFTANATQRRVVAGPVEATAIGNIMIQAKALGGVADMKEIRSVVKASFGSEVYLPEQLEAWEKGYARFKKVILKGDVK